MVVVIGISTALFTLLSFLKKDKKNYYLLIFFYAVFIFLFALRGKAGTDWVAYLDYYNNLNNLDIVKGYSFEYGYYLLNKLFFTIGFNYWTFKVITSVLISVLFYFAIRSHTKHMSMAILLGLFYFFYPSVEAVRQSISIVLFFYSLKYINGKGKRNFACYFALNLIGLLFHRTAIFCLIYYFFHKFKIVKIAAVVFVAVFLVRTEQLMQALSHMPIISNRIGYYLKGSVGSIDFAHILSLKNIEYFILTVVMTLMKGKTQKQKAVRDLILLGFIVMVSFGSYIDAMYRLAYYSDIGVLIAYCMIYDKIRREDSRSLYCIAIGIYIGIRFYRVISSRPELFIIGEL